MSLRAIEGEVLPHVDESAARISQLERDKRQLQSALSAANAETQRVREETARSLTELHRQLRPLYRALQMVFGELDAAGVNGPEPAGAAPSSPRAAAVWDMWKERLGLSAARIIDALMVQPGLNTQQLAIATGLNRNTVPKVIYEMNKAGIIDKSGGRFSLKALS